MSLFVIFLFLSNAEFSFRNVDTIKELTDILVSDEDRLVDLSSYKIKSKFTKPTRGGDLLNVVTFEDDFILLGFRLHDGDTFEHVNVTDSLLTKEVTDFDLLTILVNSNVDGEVSVHETHLVAVTMGNTGDHVLDVGTDRSDNGNVLVKTEPQVNNDVVLFLSDINKLVREVTTKSTTGSLNDDTSVLDVNFN